MPDDGKIEATYVGPGVVEVDGERVKAGDVVRVTAGEAKASDNYKPARGRDKG